MMKTLAVSAVAALAIVTAGIAGAASTSSAPAPADQPGMTGPGMMGHGWHPGHRSFGMMGMQGPGHFGGGMGGCLAEQRKPGDDKSDTALKRADLQACLTKTFGEMDTNHDGKVSFAEMQAWREAQRAKRQEAAFKRLSGGADSLSKDQLVGKPLAQFDAMDANHDGVVSRDEMKAWHKAQREKWKDERSPKGSAN